MPTTLPKWDDAGRHYVARATRSSTDAPGAAALYNQSSARGTGSIK